MDLLSEIRKIVDSAREIPSLAEAAEGLGRATDKLAETALKVGATATGPEFKVAFANALPFLNAMGDVIMGWMLLWRAAIAAPKLAELLSGADEDAQRKKIETNRNAAFYEGQVRTATYFYGKRAAGYLRENGGHPGGRALHC